MCFLFNNVNFLFLLLFIINVKSDDDGLGRVQNELKSSNTKLSDSFQNVTKSHGSTYSDSTNTSDIGVEFRIDNKQSRVKNSKLSKEINAINNPNDIGKLLNDSSSSKVNSREINTHNKHANDLYYEILQTKPNATVWSKFEFLIKPFVDKTSVEESNGIIYSKRKNLTLPSKSFATVGDKSNDTRSEIKVNGSNSGIVDENRILVRTERNTSNFANKTDRHFNSKLSQDNSWTQVSTLQSNKDQIDRFTYPTIDDKNNKYFSTKPTENVNVLANVHSNPFVDNDFDDLKRHTLATLYDKQKDSNTFTTNAYYNIHSTKMSPTSPGISTNIHPTLSSSSLTTLSNMQKPFTTVTLSGPMDHYGSTHQSVSTKSPNESKKQISNHVVSTTHKSWIHNKHDVKATNDYFSAIITAADAIKKKHKPVSSTETVLFPYYDEELVTPVLISSTKKPMLFSSSTKKPLFASSTKKPFSPIITLTKKPDFEYQTDVDTDPEEDDNEEQNEEEEEEAEYEETTTQLITTKKPYKPLFVSSTAKPVFTKRPYIIRPVINVISQPLTTTRKPTPVTYPSTTSTTTPAPPATTAAVAISVEEDSEDDDSEDSETSEERKRRRKHPHPYQSYPLMHAISSPAPYLVYQQPIQHLQTNALEKDESTSEDDEDEEEDDEFFVNPLDDSDEEDDEIVEETLEVHKSPHGGGHIYDDYPLLSKKKKKKFFKKKKHGFKLKDFKKLKKFMLPLLLAYKLKFFTMVPLLLGGLVLIVGTTGFAGFFFALFAVGLGLRGHK